MILLSATIIKIILVLSALVAIKVLYKQKISQKAFLILGVITIIVSFVFSWFAGFLPPLTDEVRLTALGEHNNEAKGSEIYLAGYTIDGVSYISGKSLKIVEGHWFWSGETYAWRPETDPRQPDGVTRTVVLRIPVGCLRTLDFSGHPYRGSVEIHTNGKRWNVDTYSEQGTVIPVSIGKSETSLLIMNQIRYLAIFTLLIFLWFAIICVILNSLERSQRWTKQNIGKIIYFVISAVAFCFMFHYADRFSLWLDEIYQIHFVKGSLMEALQYCLMKLHECSPPFALLCSTIWYKIAPYGEQWLLLVSMLLCALSIYVLGLIGERLQNIYCGVLSAIMFAFSTTVWLNVAYEYRAYPYMVAFSVLTLYFYIRKNELESEPIWSVAFSLSMACLAMSHYFGMLACAIYFLGDLFLWLKKQITWKAIFLYFFPGICSVIWLAAVILYQGISFTSSLTWYGSPSVSNIKALLEFLTGRIDLFYWILLFGIANAMICCFSSKKRSSQTLDLALFYRGFFVAGMIGTIFALFIYGVYINPQSTLWSERYFLFLIPNAILLSAIALCDLEKWGFGQNIFSGQGKIIIFVWLFLSIHCFGVITSSTTQLLSSYSLTSRTSEPYRESADWLYQQSNYIFNDTTLIIIGNNLAANGDAVKSGWSEYYITRQGRRDPLNIYSANSLNGDAVLQYERVYISYLTDIPLWLHRLLDEHYTVVEDNYSKLRLKTFIRK